MEPGSSTEVQGIPNAVYAVGGIDSLDASQPGLDDSAVLELFTPVAGAYQVIVHARTTTSYTLKVVAHDRDGNVSQVRTETGSVATGQSVTHAFSHTSTPGSPALRVTPIGTVDLGTVPVDGSADRTFTVQNVGNGTLTGTASVGAPWSIVSGGSYSVVAGASQTVSVRFRPTSASTFLGSVTFTGGGGASRTVTGTGAPSSFLLTVASRGSATGSVTSTPAGIACGATCSASFNNGTGVTLTAVAGSGATFRQWGGACTGSVTTCTVTMNAAQAVTAIFAAVFTDASVTAGATAIRAVHVTELRAAIDALRRVNGVSMFAWTDLTVVPRVTVVKRAHLLELRTAHLNELRAAVRNLE